MALISCIECQNPVSDKAVACPHCGCPLANHAMQAPQLGPTADEYVAQIMAAIRSEIADDALDIRVGRLVKTRVRIDSEAISFGRKSERCRAIHAIGWWSQTTKNLEWAQNEWTTGWIWLKGEYGTMKLTVPGMSNFELITGKIWRVVGIRLLENALRRLDEGLETDLCGLSMNGDGLMQKKFGAGNEAVPWKKVTHGIWDGKITIWSRADKRRKATVSYRHADNAPILAAVLQLRREHLIKGVSWQESLFSH